MVLALTLVTGAPALVAIGPAFATAAATSWTPQAPLSAPDPATQANFGTVVIAGFGTTAVVSAPNAPVGGNAGAGAAYVFVKSGTTWSFQAELTASDGAAADGFGTAISTTKDGSTVVVGAPNRMAAGNDGAGTAYVFTRTGTAWTQTAELTGAPAAPKSLFGAAVAINGIATRIAVAAPKRRVAQAQRAGVVYVFKKVGSAWVQNASLTEPQPVTNDNFGYALVAKETQVLASSPYHLNANGSSGVVYGFDDPDGPYVQKSVLAAADGRAGDAFGSSMSLSGAALVIGAPAHAVNGVHEGAAYVFTHSDRTGIWTSRAELVASDAAEADIFGASVAISGTTIVVGDPGHRVGKNGHAGAAYVFTGAAANWTQRAELTRSGAGALTELGRSVATSGSTVMLGEPYQTLNADLAGSGFVDVFEAS